MLLCECCYASVMCVGLVGVAMRVWVQDRSKREKNPG